MLTVTRAVDQIPAAVSETIPILMRADSAGCCLDLIDWCRDGEIEFSVGLPLTETVRGAILQIPATAWVSAVDQDGTPRPNGQVCEITDRLDLTTWPERPG